MAAALPMVTTDDALASRREERKDERTQTEDDDRGEHEREGEKMVLGLGEAYLTRESIFGAKDEDVEEEDCCREKKQEKTRRRKWAWQRRQRWRRRRRRLCAAVRLCPFVFSRFGEVRRPPKRNSLKFRPSNQIVRSKQQLNVNVTLISKR